MTSKSLWHIKLEKSSLKVLYTKDTSTVFSEISKQDERLYIFVKVFAWWAFTCFSFLPSFHFTCHLTVWINVAWIFIRLLEQKHFCIFPHESDSLHYHFKPQPTVSLPVRLHSVTNGPHLCHHNTLLLSCHRHRLCAYSAVAAHSGAETGSTDSLTSHALWNIHYDEPRDASRFLLRHNNQKARRQQPGGTVTKRRMDPLLAATWSQPTSSVLQAQLQEHNRDRQTVCG